MDVVDELAVVGAARAVDQLDDWRQPGVDATHLDEGSLKGVDELQQRLPVILVRKVGEEVDGLNQASKEFSQRIVPQREVFRLRYRRILDQP